MPYEWLIVVFALSGAILLLRDRFRRRPVPRALRAGNPLPDFGAIAEDGRRVQASDLRGKAAVLLFVRGTWCPFCSRQVQELTECYKEINESGARLILVTPKPLETTRRVAEFFDVRFEFWLDESLDAAKKLGLLLSAGVPADFREEYGEDSLWPAALVVDADGIIRYTALSRFIVDRPDPKKLLRVLSRL